MTISGKRCVVTGASSGIGRAIALGLVAAGGRVLAVGRSSERLESLAGEGGDAVVPIVADLESDDGIFAVARAALGGESVDVLIHSAGTIALGSLESVSVADLDRDYRVNLRAPFELTRLLIPALRDVGGQVVFVNSSAARRPGASNVAYAATKAGLRALADGVRQDVNRHGVRVLTVYVGRAATPMQKAVHEHEGRPYRPESLLRVEDVAEVVVASLSLPRSGEITDVAVRPMTPPLETAT